MKKVTLTIEAPDDFKKGDCRNCPLDIPAVMTVDCYSDNCPLEIQDDEQIVKFYYCESEDKYLIGQRTGNFYYAEFDGKYWTWCMSRYLPWGEDKYPSEPIELDFLTWFEGFKKKYIYKENNQ